MKLLFVHLKRTEFLDDLLLAMTQVGVCDPAIIEAVGGQNRLLSNVPIFASLLGGPSRRREFHRVILAPVADDTVVDRILRALSDGGIEWAAEDLGAIALLPLERWTGPVGEQRG
jgi:hypothetical protein